MNVVTDAGHRIALRAERVLTPADLLRPGWVVIEGGVIASLGSSPPPSGDRVVDLGDRLLAPGFVDLHVHGGDGAEVNAERPGDAAEAVHRLARFHARHGTTSLLATTVTDSRERLVASLRGIGRCIRDRRIGTARVLGAHLEGPWLSPERAGAHDRDLLRRPEQDDVAALLAADAGVLRLVTLAPELPAAFDAIRTLVDAGVVVAVGHTAADFATTKAAFDCGARHVTHLFNAMPALDHRRPGPVGAALTDPRVTVEVIADGVHVSPVLLDLVARAAPGRFVAVTDAMAATGLVPGPYRLGRQPVDVLSDRAVLSQAPETLAGSLLTMDRAVSNLVAAGVGLSEAVCAATRTPADVIGEARRGRIAVGAEADLVVLDEDLACVATLVGGDVVHDAGGLFAGVSRVG